MTRQTNKKTSFWKNVIKYRALLLMVLPGFIWFIFFFYIPVLANVVAFKDFHYSAGLYGKFEGEPLGWFG